VQEGKRTAYITTHHPALDDYLRQEFSKESVSWKEIKIGDYHVFYNLSRPLDPKTIGLGILRE
jgi:hypothetical protein